MNDFAPLSSAGTRPFADFHVADVGAVDGEAQGAAHLVETVAAGSAGVEVKLAAAYAIADLITDDDRSEENIIPGAFDPRVAEAVANAVAEAARESGVARC